MAAGTARRRARPMSFAERASNVRLLGWFHCLIRENESRSHNAIMASGKKTRAVPDQSRKSLPLELPESQENVPATRAADQTQSTGRHHCAAGPRFAPYTLKRKPAMGRLDHP